MLQQVYKTTEREWLNCSPSFIAKGITLFNKRIYYISGFDPRGSRFYHRLFREESKKSELISGGKISTGKRKVIDDVVTQWQVDSVWNGESYKTDYRIMTWDDVMKHYWISALWMLILKSIPMYFNHIKIRLFPKFKKAGNGPYICSIYPLLFSFASLLLIALFGFITYFLTFSLFKQMWLAIAASASVMYFFVKYATRLGEKLSVWWILQTYFFISRWAEKPLPELDEKMRAFAEKIIHDQAESPVDEIILVGHCVGSMLAVQVMANIVGLQHDGLKGKLSVMTMGQCIPYLSYAPTATHYRKVLQTFANNQHYPWFDMGARADPLCFQQVNPAIAEGINLDNEKVPNRFVIKPYEMFEAEKYKALKQNKLRIHFQYLMAADIKTDFDYFEIVTGSAENLQKYKTL